MATKNEIFKRFLSEYLKTNKERKGEILDNICDTTKMNRKSAVRKFKALQLKDPNKEEKRGRPLYYTPDVSLAPFRNPPLQKLPMLRMAHKLLPKILCSCSIISWLFICAFRNPYLNTK